MLFLPKVLCCSFIWDIKLMVRFSLIFLSSFSFLFFLSFFFFYCLLVMVDFTFKWGVLSPLNFVWTTINFGAPAKNDAPSRKAKRILRLSSICTINLSVQNHAFLPNKKFEQCYWTAPSNLKLKTSIADMESTYNLIKLLI